jgi:5S rRNA maturation endonuclease (ribonuclease M5)
MRTKQTMCPVLVLHDQSSAGEPLRRALAGKLEKSARCHVCRSSSWFHIMHDERLMRADLAALT